MLEGVGGNAMSKVKFWPQTPSKEFSFPNLPPTKGSRPEDKKKEKKPHKDAHPVKRARKSK